MSAAGNLIKLAVHALEGAGEKEAAQTVARKVAQRAAPEAAPVLAVARKAPVKAPAIVKSVSGSRARAAAGAGYDAARLRTAYPEVAAPTLAVDKKTGKEFLQKTVTPEAEALSVARRAAQKDIDAGNYTPYFDPSDRYYADPSAYDLTGNTLTDVVPKRPDTLAKYTAQAEAPEGLDRLRNAYAAGLEHPGAADWYAMGQLEDAFKQHYGPEMGRELFKRRFADSMAATTGGADPTSNLMMAHYGNTLDAAGQRVPEAAYDLPFPIGGRYAAGNLGMFNKLIVDRGGLTTANPKRFNFSSNFLGDRSRATIDEQMSGLFDPGMAMPPPVAYGVYEGALGKLAREAGVPPANYQDVAWAGGKLAMTPNFKPKPMIDIVNEAIERTARLTGQEPDDVVAGIVKADRPLFARGGPVTR